MNKEIKKILLTSGAIICAACGTTKVKVTRPENGTFTTITVTTNNPITTDVPSNIELKMKGEKQ